MFTIGLSTSKFDVKRGVSADKNALMWFCRRALAHTIFPVGLATAVSPVLGRALCTVITQ